MDVGGIELASHTVVDAGVAWRRAGMLDPYLRVENLLDREFEGAVGYPAPGRTLVAGVALSLAR